MLVGRKKERSKLSQLYNEDKSHFVALYGRRRVGKTYLIRQHFENDFTFFCSGLLNGNKKQQLTNFWVSMTSQLSYLEETKIPDTWFEAFHTLALSIDKKKIKSKKVIFLDELPWMDTKGSDFILGLDYFWNSWASARKDILLIVCGSATSWMVTHIFNNAGGLYKRVTSRIKVDPFTLKEVYDFFTSRNFLYSQEQCIQAYMVFGGIPYYLEQFSRDLSPIQNVDNLLFGQNALLDNEFELLFKSLFTRHDTYIEVVRAIAQKNKGVTRDEIMQHTGMASGGTLTKILANLENCNFIRRYQSIYKKSKESLYQVIDPYCLFVKNMEINFSNQGFWISNFNSPKYHNWSGYAFEIVCLNHVEDIKKALGINGIITHTYSWSHPNAQIDLIIDRNDQVMNLCEIKYSQAPYIISKKYDMELRNKIAQFRQNYQVKKALWPVFIAPYGLAKGPYNDLFLNALDNKIFFD